jgi:hypothetical protein
MPVCRSSSAHTPHAACSCYKRVKILFIRNATNSTLAAGYSSRHTRTIRKRCISMNNSRRAPRALETSPYESFRPIRFQGRKLNFLFIERQRRKFSLQSERSRMSPDFPNRCERGNSSHTRVLFNALPFSAENTYNNIPGVCAMCSGSGIYVSMLCYYKFISGSQSWKFEIIYGLIFL